MRISGHRHRSTENLRLPRMANLAEYWFLRLKQILYTMQ